jgi:hypothetical protein
LLFNFPAVFLISRALRSELNTIKRMKKGNEKSERSERERGVGGKGR